jgi:hypothetical protein
MPRKAMAHKNKFLYVSDEKESHQPWVRKRMNKLAGKGARASSH